jgi:hypothetical protein
VKTVAGLLDVFTPRWGNNLRESVERAIFGGANDAGAAHRAPNGLGQETGVHASMSRSLWLHAQSCSLTCREHLTGARLQQGRVEVGGPHT